MRQVVREFQQKAHEADFVAVIDDAGSHSARQLLDEATRLAAALSDGRADAAGGTVMVQADNSWRTVAAILAVGLTGGVIAVVNRHTTHAEFSAAWEDIRPDAVVAEPSAMDESLGTKILRVFGMSECPGHTSPSPDDPEEIRLG
jgi:acyl-CoA synthetase (AMP-forming)/AMP-acid ligase II